MKRTVWILVCLVVLTALAWGQRFVLKMFPYGVQEAYSSWVIGEGLPDARGNANFAIEMEKGTPITSPGMAIVTFEVTDKVPVTYLTQGSGLSWEYRSDGHCGTTSPRWRVVIKGRSGAEYILALPCSSANQFPGSAAGWTKANFYASDINNALWQKLGSQTPDALAGQITYLFIIYDAGPDEGPGFVILDNIRVNQQLWTGPNDNNR